MVGVGLFITIIIIAAVMLITGIGTNLVNKGTNKAGNVAAQLDQTELEQYDNTTMSGAQVLSAIKKYWNDSTIVVGFRNNPSDKNAVTAYTTPIAFLAGSTIDDRMATSGNYYAFVDSGSKVGDNPDHSSDSIGNYSKAGDIKYISPSAQYKAYIIKINNILYGISFVKQ